MSSEPIARQYASFAANLTLADIPDEVQVATRRHILDGIGVMVAAMRTSFGTQGALLAAVNGGAGHATAIGLPDKVPATSAALANGMLGHALDFDDSHSPSITHPTAVLVPAALAVAEMTGASAQETLVALAAGYEINNRVGAVAGRRLMDAGIHSTSTAGAFAAASIAALLMGLDEEGHKNALGLVGSQASGILEFLTDGTDAKQLHAGWAANAGVTAAFLASRGLTGPATVFEGPKGFFASHMGRDEVSCSGMAEELGSLWTGLEITYKQYPACHLSHATVNAYLAIARDKDVHPDQIDEITCMAPDYYIPVLFESRDEKLNPRSGYEAKFSMPYCIARTALKGPPTLEDFEEAAFTDGETLAFAKRVTYVQEDYPEFPAEYPGGVRVKLKNGQEYTQYARATPVLTEADLKNKFQANCAPVLGAASTQTLAGEILSFGKSNEKQVTDILAPLRFDGLAS